jgi:hypothetical protein
MALNSSGPISLGRSDSSAYGDSIALELGLAQGATVSLNDNDTRRVAKVPFSGSTISMPTNFLNRTVLGFNTTNNLILTADNTGSEGDGSSRYTAQGILFFQAVTYPGLYGQYYVGDIFYSVNADAGGMNAGYPTSYSVRNGVQPLTQYKVDFTGYGLYFTGGDPYAAWFAVEAFDESTFEYRSYSFYGTSGTYSTGWNNFYNPGYAQVTRLQMYLYIINYSEAATLTPFVSGTVYFRNTNNTSEEISRNFTIICAVRAAGT